MLSKSKIKKYLSATRVHFFTDTLDKYDALNELCKLASTDKRIEDAERFMKAIHEREAVSSTGIGSGVAVPHTKLDCIHEFSITIGISESGIEYNSADEKLVHVMLLIAANDRDRKEYLMLLASIAHLFKSGELQKELCTLKKGSELINCLLNSLPE